MLGTRAAVESWRLAEEDEFAERAGARGLILFESPPTGVMSMKMRFRLIALVAATLALPALADDDCYSQGVRVGVVQKFSQKGVVNKSWEGELVMDGTKFSSSRDGIRGGNVWAFSVLDPNVAKVIDGSVMSGRPIALHYCQVLMPMFTTDTGYRITQAVERGQ